MWQQCSTRNASIDGVGFSIWRHTLKMGAMTSFSAENCCHLASELPAPRVLPVPDLYSAFVFRITCFLDLQSNAAADLGRRCRRRRSIVWSERRDGMTANTDERTRLGYDRILHCCCCRRSDKRRGTDRPSTPLHRPRLQATTLQQSRVSQL